ncbi:MAG: hypothetical protein M9918_22835 [Anaerolineae bacterium]|nr:hypothetical protein [Anaerolineae bacterium]
MPKGGKREGAGRKPTYKKAKVQKTVRLPQRWIDILEADFGRFQTGVESLVKRYIETKKQEE